MTPRLCSVFLSVVCTSVALAQAGAPARKMASVSGTITPRQGEAIITAAWTRERRDGSSPDCSHLVHEVYVIAGLSYPYTDSFDLYAGTENFARVTRPQPGDLVVWRGHVGIVVDPAEHSFYSSVRSGMRTEFYDAPYWRARGLARFYRYVTTAPTRVTLTQQRSTKMPREPVQVVSVPVVEDPLESTSTLAQPTATNANPTSAAAGSYEPPSTLALAEIPSNILVAATQELPTQEDVAEAVSELNNATASILRAEDLTHFGRKVVIYDELAVQHVDAKGQRGSARTLIDSRVALVGQHIERNRRREEVRWNLLRTAQGWEVLAHEDRIYVPRDVAVHLLATRLALLTQDASAAHTNSVLSEQAQIVRVLSALLQGI